ncbi:MAG: DUF1848 domain-containing protein [Treponema sp.]|jgi:hypothetical protein|nr:DUF1848 domain-containing protein [Treponema sp.]
MVISVSRRCDIPRFRFDWFLERLDAGFVEVANPYNTAQVRRVSLQPGDVDALAFWTRDPRPILAHAAELETRGYRYYLMVSLTGYPALLEPNCPGAGAVIRAMGELAAKIGPERLIWRYDPVLLTTVTGPDFHRRNFRQLAEALEGAVRRVIISVYDEYRGSQKRLEALEAHSGTGFRALAHYEDEPEEAGPAKDGGRLLPEVWTLLEDLADIAGEAGLETRSCAEAPPGDGPEPGRIIPGACIDGELLHRLWGLDLPGRDQYQRPRCGCVPSVDIGSYGPCPAACVYCYAWR